MLKSCSTCPSRVDKSEVGQVFGRSIGADICARYGHALDRPGQPIPSNDRVKVNFASSCKDHGEARPVTITRKVRPQVALPGAKSAYFKGNMKVTSCTQCVNYVPAGVVLDQMGWSVGMCAVKGQLILESDTTEACKGCSDAGYGQARSHMSGITLLPMYDVSESDIMNPAAAANAKDRVEPRDYDTDAPVDDEDRAVGIIAWRSVADPEGLHEDVLLPVFDGDALCGFDVRDTYAGRSPQSYIDHMGILYDLTAEMVYDNRVPLLEGEAGSGKTEAAAWMAWLMNLPFTHLLVEKNTESYQFIGEPSLVVDPATGKNVTQFNHGEFARAIQRPGVVLIDEPNNKAEIYEFIRDVILSRRLKINANGGEIISQHVHCYLMLAQNPSRDPRFMGTSPINAADMNRVTMMEFAHPKDSIERQIIVEHCADAGYAITSDLVDAIISIGKELREMIANGTLMVSWGVRSSLKVARMTRFYSLEKAFRRALVDGLDEPTRELLMPLIRSAGNGSVAP